MKQAFTLLTIFGALGMTMQAGVVQLTFTGLKNQEQVANYFNGGTGGGRYDENGAKYADGGSKGGTNYGVSFGGNSLAVVGEDFGGTGLFANNPSRGTTVLSFNDKIKGTSFMNVAAGFTTGIAFWYSQPFYPTMVKVYDGLDGTGKVLATLNMAQSATNCPLDKAGNSLANCWTPVGLSFNGVAKSVDFSGANFTAFDNLTIGSATPVPYPPFFTTTATCPIPNGIKSFILEHTLEPTGFVSSFIPSFAPSQLAVFFDPAKVIHTRFEFTTDDNVLRAWSFALPIGAPPITPSTVDYKTGAVATATIPISSVLTVCAPRPAVALVGTVADGTPVYGSLVGLPHWVSFSINPNDKTGFNAANIVVVNAGTTSILANDGSITFVAAAAPTTPVTPPGPGTTGTKAVANPKGSTVTSRAIQLDGTQSVSADGKPLTYAWSIPQGSPSAAILGGTTATPTVEFAQGRGLYQFRLTVTDSTGATATDIAMVNFQGN